MPKIVLEVSQVQLDKMVAELKKTEPEYEVLDPLKLLELILKRDLEHLDCFLDRFIDGGGNALIGDCLEEEECKGVVVEHQDQEGDE